MTINPLTQAASSIVPSYIAINALDPERLKTFYVERIGLKVINPDSTKPWISLGTSNDHELLRLYPTKSPKDRRTTGLYHFALLMPNRRHLGNILNHLIQTNTPLIGASDHGYSEAVYLNDPEGNGIEIYVDKEIADWDIKEDGTIVGVTDPMDADGVLASADDNAFTGLSEETKMGHFHLHVHNIDETIHFYHHILGLGNKFLMGDSATFMATGNYHHHLGANIWLGPNLPPAQDNTQGLRTLVWRATATEFQRLLEHLTATNQTFIEDNNKIIINDPAGITNVIEIKE